MDDLLEKTIQGLECCRIPFKNCHEKGCPYYENVGCKIRLKDDALALLKAQEQKESEWVKMTGMMIPELHGYHMCKNCEWHEDYHKRETLYPYCPACGAKMKNGGKAGCG